MTLSTSLVKAPVLLDVQYLEIKSRIVLTKRSADATFIELLLWLSIALCFNITFFYMWIN